MLAAALGARKEEHAAVPTRLRALRSGTQVGDGVLCYG